MSEITLEQRVEALEKNMKAILGIKPLYKGENDMHEPNEPLIKDEKIRKAVRAWAEINDVNSVVVAHHYNATILVDRQGIQISFDNEGFYLPKGKEYIIEELCGEEE